MIFFNTFISQSKHKKMTISRFLLNFYHKKIKNFFLLRKSQKKSKKNFFDDFFVSIKRIFLYF